MAARSPSLPPVAFVAAIVVFAAGSDVGSSGPRPRVAVAAPPASLPRPLASPETARLDAEARAPATDVRLAPSSRGVFGAWLLCGPFKTGKTGALETVPPGADEKTPAAAGAPCAPERDLGDRNAKKKVPATKWLVGASNSGPVDLKTQLDLGTGAARDLVAYAAGTLHLERAEKLLLLLGVDDGVRVSIDGKTVYTRDDARPVRDDDDIVPLDLGAGDHEIVLKLHQRDGAWAFRARVVDGTLTPPRGAYLKLAGTTVDDARSLASKMSLVGLERTFDTTVEPPRYRPTLTVAYAEGAPRGVPLTVTTRVGKERPNAPPEPAFELAAGGVPVTSAGVSDLVVSLPSLTPFAGTMTVDSTVAGRPVHHVLPSRPASEQALARLERALAKAKQDEPWLPEGSRISAQHLAKRMSRELARGDTDVEAQADEAKELDRLAAAIEKKTDPYEGRTGAMRRAIRSRIDGEPTELGLYVPPWYKPTRKFPVVVGLHGLNGYAMSMMRWLWGNDDPKRDQAYEDRHLDKVPAVDAILVTPLAHGNTLYRELGESDVMQVLDWVTKTYAVDETRITITGPSMGGIGSAAIPLHRPHVFAGAMPLCGYHSYLIRSDVAGRPIRPWERYLAEERSNVLWAENGHHLPLYVVHGTQDKPEENSGVLIERYEKLSYSIKHEHPESGHNVWQEAYEELKGLTWLMNRRTDLHPANIRFKTTRTRWSQNAWLSVDELQTENRWADVNVRAKKKEQRISGTTSNVAQLTFARDEKLFPEATALTVDLDGQSLAFDATEAVVAHREGTAWKKGPAQHAGVIKRGAVTGPLRDVFYEPILFVWADGDEARANQEVARAFAKIRWGVHVAYPMMSDTEFLAKNEPLAHDRALFLVGRGNKVLAALTQKSGVAMPIEIDAGVVRVGKEKYTGKELGAAFIRPNPVRPDRYVVVMAGADVAGMLRALSLPDLLPDFMVWDEQVAPARGAVLLGSGSFRAAGLFQKDWSLPATLADPLARARRETGATVEEPPEE